MLLLVAATRSLIIWKTCSTVEPGTGMPIMLQNAKKKDNSFELHPQLASILAF
jgi:hypothetical protein